MTQTKTGVVGGAGSFNKWQWVCECGAHSAEAFDDREKARDALKEHRKECSLRRRPAASPAAQEAAVAKKEKATSTAEKKPAAEKKARKRQEGVKPEVAKAALARIQAGSSTLFAESKALGFTHNGPLRAALRTLLGAEKYTALMAGRRGRQKKAKTAPKKAAAKKPAAEKKEVPAEKKPAKKPAAKKAAPPTEQVAPPAAAEPAGASSES